MGAKQHHQSTYTDAVDVAIVRCPSTQKKERAEQEPVTEKKKCLNVLVTTVDLRWTAKFPVTETEVAKYHGFSCLLYCQRLGFCFYI